MSSGGRGEGSGQRTRSGGAEQVGGAYSLAFRVRLAQWTPACVTVACVNGQPLEQSSRDTVEQT
eukprot:73036-Rhodomonas_salina.2